MICCSVLILILLGIDLDLNLLAYFIFYVTRRRRTPAFLVHVHMFISDRDVQKVIPSVVIFRERRGHGGESFVGVINSQRYKYSSSGTFTAVHIQLRYVSTVDAVGGPFVFSEPRCPSGRSGRLPWCCVELQGCVVNVRRQKDVLR